VKRYAAADSLRAGLSQPGPLAAIGSADFVRPGTAGLVGVRNGLTFDDNGLLYVSSVNTDEVLRFDETGQAAGTGQFVSNDLGGLDEPGTILFHRGRVLVVSPNTDSGLHSGVPTAKVLRYTTNGAFVDSFIPENGGGLDNPRHLTFGPDGNLYVTSDAHSDSVLRYNGTTGDFMGAFVTDSSGGLSDPFGLAFGPGGDLYVASQGTNQVLRYDGTTGNFKGVFAIGITEPRGITFDSAGRMYVSSLADDSVLRFSSTGQFLNFFVPTFSLGGLEDPAAMKFGPDGNFYVASEGTGEILRYNGVTGAFIDVFTGPSLGSGIAGPLDFQFVNVPAGFPGLEFIQPGLYMFATSSADDRILRFDGRTGAFIDDFVTSGNEGLDRPAGMAYRPGPGGRAGELFVTSADTDEVFRYDIDSRATFDYYEFSVDNEDGSEVVIDIDFLRDDPKQTDTIIFLSNGDFNDDFSKFAGGEGSFRSLDAILGGDPNAPLILDPGTYVLAVAEFDPYNGVPKESGNPGGPTNMLDRNDSYTLHISMTDRDDFAEDGLAPVVVRDFEGLATRPRQAGGFENVVFAVDTLGNVFALSVDPNNPANPARNGIPKAFFVGDDPYVIVTEADHARGLALSDTLLHVTESRHADPGRVRRDASPSAFAPPPPAARSRLP
jgi:DNA-binding beta-propeller fold protein YncE